MNPEQFYQQFVSFAKNQTDPELAPFLRALYGILPKYQDLPCSFELLLKILEEGLTAKPIAWNPEWQQITEAPSGNRLVRKFTNPSIKAGLDRNIELETKGMAFTYEVLRFQLAELDRMKGKQLDDPMRFFGVRSDAGHDWYNFTAFSVLECGIRCMIDNGDSAENLDWSILGTLLEDGRIYE